MTTSGAFDARVDDAVSKLQSCRSKDVLAATWRRTKILRDELKDAGELSSLELINDAYRNSAVLCFQKVVYK